MRICIISYHTCPFSPFGGDGVGGMNVYLKELGSALSACPQTEIDIFTRAKDPNLEVIKRVAPNIRVIHLPTGSASSVDRRRLFDYLPEFMTNLGSFVEKENKGYDVIYSHYWLSGLAGEFLKQRLNIPLVHTYHTLAFLKERVSVRLEHASRKLVEEHLAHVSDSIFSTSSEEKLSLINEYGISPGKIEVIYPGVNHKLFYLDQTDRLFKETGFSKKNKILLYVGRIEPVKGLMTVIESMDTLNKGRNSLAGSLRLAVIGGGKKGKELSDNPEVFRIREAVYRKGLASRIAFLGSKPQSVLREYYSAADALVVPSLYESFGLVVVESLACGTPVLVSSVGKMKTIIEEGKNGFSFVPGRASTLAESIEGLFAGRGSLWDERTIRKDVTGKFSWKKTGEKTYHALSAMNKKCRQAGSTRILQLCESPRPA